MRIYYRAFDKKKRKMYGNENISITRGKCYVLRETNQGKIPILLPNERMELMEAIGLRDMELKKIYVDDIVEMNNEIYIVKWNQEKCCYGFYNKDNTMVSQVLSDSVKKIGHPSMWTISDVLVIGNRLQNQDLITKLSE